MQAATKQSNGLTPAPHALTAKYRRDKIRGVCEAELGKIRTRFTKIDRYTATKPTLAHQLEDIISRAKGGVIRDIFRVLNQAMGRKATGGAKLATMKMADGTIINEPAQVRAAAAAHGKRTLAAEPASVPIMKELLHELMPNALERERPEEGQRGLDAACKWESFQAALRRCAARKGAGNDGFNTHLLKSAHTTLQRRYWRALVGCVREKQFPHSWKQWIAMLTLKPEGDAQDIGQYRDLWLVPHGQKLLMHMLNAEYIGATGWSVPGSQAGWELGRSCTEQMLALRLMTEHAALESRDLCVGFQDLSTCFMSILKSIQSEVERQLGVDPAVSQVVEALHYAVQGRFQTEHGLSETFTVDKGTGQGCHNGPARAKLTIAPAQRAVSQHCVGYKVRDGKGGSAPQMYYADMMAASQQDH